MINITQVKKVGALFGVDCHVPYISNVAFKSFHETSIENGCCIGKNCFLSITTDKTHKRNCTIITLTERFLFYTYFYITSSAYLTNIIFL